MSRDFHGAGPKLLFVGAGAIGSYLGAFLSRSGHDVTLVDPLPLVGPGWLPGGTRRGVA